MPASERRRDHRRVRSRTLRRHQPWPRSQYPCLPKFRMLTRLWLGIPVCRRGIRSCADHARVHSRGRRLIELRLRGDDETLPPSSGGGVGLPHRRRPVPRSQRHRIHSAAASSRLYPQLERRGNAVQNSRNTPWRICRVASHVGSVTAGCAQSPTITRSAHGANRATTYGIGAVLGRARRSSICMRTNASALSRMPSRRA